MSKPTNLLADISHATQLCEAFISQRQLAVMHASPDISKEGLGSWEIQALKPCFSYQESSKVTK